jgi:hypothetical protein
MGFMTVVVLLNDRLDECRKNAVDLMERICHRAAGGETDDRIEKWAANYGYPAPEHLILPSYVQIPSIHHADNTAIIAVGGNCTTKLGEFWGWSHHTPEAQLQILEEMADRMGYRLVKKPAKKAATK